MSIAIIGAGLSGLAASYFIGHKNCVIYEKTNRIGGHCKTHIVNDAVWDEGPHVSFTKDPFVLDLFKDSVDGDYESLEIKTGNFWNGRYFPHPVQMYLSHIPSPIKEECLSTFLKARRTNADLSSSLTYGEWLSNAFGEGLKTHFIEKYTRKYWCQSSSSLATNWIGPRMLLPTVEEVLKGANEKLEKDYHYIQSAIYPKKKGFENFLSKIKDGARVKFGKEVMSIDFSRREIIFKGGSIESFSKLISTAPLNEFVSMIKNVPNDVLNAAQLLSCTSVQLINVTTSCPSTIPYHWFYVYDSNYVSTRISQNHLLSPENMRPGTFGYQVEVYSLNKKYEDTKKISDVVNELREMGLISDIVEYFSHFVPFANVVPDLNRTPAVETIFEYLSKYGLIRETGDNHPIHTNHFKQGGLKNAAVILAGRYAQWTYGWTDDCIRRASHIAECII